MTNSIIKSTESYNPKRSIFICELEVGFAQTEMVARKLAKLEAKSDEPIDVVINTEGSLVYQALAIYDLLCASPCKIRTYGLGAVMSGGAIMMMAGDERVMYPNATMLIHEAWFVEEPDSTPDVLELEKIYTQKLSDRTMQIIADRSGHTVEFMLSLVKGADLYVGAEEAITYGFADSIVSVSRKFGTSL